MLENNKDYRCENCRNFDESVVPADCLKGHGKVAFRHLICSDFIEKEENCSDREC